MSRKLLLLSTSTVHGSTFLEYCLPEVEQHFNGVHEILFIPYARPSGISYDEYTQLVRDKLENIGKKVIGIHELNHEKSEISNYKGIYIGGGNTFLLLKTLYDYDLLNSIRDGVMNGQIRYMGSSAGTNVACKTMNNTNDMPIVYPPSFDALNLIPFNINPHYLDPDPNSTHKGETRETRINEFHKVSDIPVVGLREGSHLRIYGNEITLGGLHSARIFRAGKKATELKAEADFSFLLS